MPNSRNWVLRPGIWNRRRWGRRIQFSDDRIRCAGAIRRHYCLRFRCPREKEREVAIRCGRFPDRATELMGNLHGTFENFPMSFQTKKVFVNVYALEQRNERRKHPRNREVRWIPFEVDVPIQVEDVRSTRHMIEV